MILCLSHLLLPVPQVWLLLRGTLAAVAAEPPEVESTAPAGLEGTGTGTGTGIPGSGRAPNASTGLAGRAQNWAVSLRGAAGWASP